MEMVVPRTRELSDLLSHASSADLDVLADLITDNGKGRVALDSSVKAIILKRKAQGALQSIPDILESEIRAFGGNTLRNFMRTEGVEYRELAVDVAKKLGGKPDKDDDIFSIEGIAIDQAIAAFKETKASNPSIDLNDKLALVVSSLVTSSSTLFGAAAAGGTAGLMGALGGRLASLAVPPLAIVATAGAAVQVAAPAFRVTVPAVLQIAKIRHARFEADFTSYTEALHACM